MNVGAEKETDYGDYFMWGSTKPNTDTLCDWGHAPFNGGAETSDEAYFNSVKNTVCPNGILAKEYDVAYKATKGIARMPTQAELQELVNNTTNKYIKNYNGSGVNGRKFTGSNGKYIFIPASGRRYSSMFENKGTSGTLWTSSLYAAMTDCAYFLYFSSTSIRPNSTDGHNWGMPVRGVL